MTSKLAGAKSLGAFARTGMYTAVSRQASFAMFLVAVLMLLVGMPARAHLVDTFTRADSATVGNGWIEKNPAAFAVAGNAVTKAAVATGYRDNLVYRPNSEDVLDVEAAMEFRLLSTPPGYPQIMVRVQSATVGTADTVDGYMLYVNDSATQAVLGRQRGTAFVTTLATLNLTTALNATDTFRLRLRAQGTNPVQLQAYVERLSGSVWSIIGQANAADSDANRIATAGSVGFSGYVEANYAVDNFARVDLGAVGTTNPAPTLASMSPTTATAGEAGLTIVVYGSGFTTDSVVRWNSSNRPTTYISPSELEAALTTADLAAAGSFPVTVLNPSPGGGTSGALAFQVQSPGVGPPTVNTLSPSSVTAGSGAFTLTVTGSNLNASSVVRWNGADRTTTFVSATQLQAAIPAGDVASAGSATVDVRRASDGAVSNSQTFTISSAAAGGDFADNFNRANSATIGNGWIEKAAAAFSIAGNEAAKVGAGASDYRDNIVYRPASEDLLDTEASIEFRLLSQPVGYPQVMVRVQSNTAATTNTLDAYLLYMFDSPTQAALSRQRGNAYDTVLVTFDLNAALNTTDRYRLRLRATGTNPVQLNGFVERLNGGSWQILGQASFSDGSAQRIATAGSTGFGGYVETSYAYDNFVRSNLGAPSPVPATTSLNPSSASAGSGAINITVNGSNFAASSVVRWNGSDRVTSFVSASQLTAQITAADLAAQGSASVTVYTPAPGGGTSNAQTFTITAPANNPVPGVTSLSPSSTSAGSSAFTLTVNGSNFVPSSVVRWNGGNRTTAYVSATQLTAQITATDVASAGTANVSVFTPTPGGGTSGTLTFTINAQNNPVPAITGLNPSSAIAGSPGFTLVVLGSNFVNGSTVRWNGSNRTTTFISSGEVRATISSGDIASSGTRTVTVFNPAPGGGTSGSVSFVVNASGPNNPAPVLTQLSPTAAQTGSGATLITVLGSSFTNESVVQWNGSARTTTYISGSELRASISSSDLNSAGVATVTVSTPAPGGGLSTPLPFFVQDTSLDYFFDSFNRPDNATVGNNWTEKNPGAFSVQGNQLISFDTEGGFQQDIMYRGPTSEDRLDVETSTEFVRLPSEPNLGNANFPQLHARVQRSSVTQNFTLDSYIFFIDDIEGRGMFAITRSPTPGSRWECYIAAVPLSQQLVVGERYRLRLRVSGTAPVQLNGTIERFAAGAWQMIGSGSTTHSTTTQRDPALYCDFADLPDPITNAGSVGVAKWINRTDTYDNFFWRELTPSAPPPTIISLNPQFVNAGSNAFTLTVNGSNFSPDAVVRWNGANRTTTFISSTQLQASIPASDVTAPGLASISVVLPGSGLVSGTTSFEIRSANEVQTLFDNFDRANNAAIGNGWIEKTAAAFSISGNRAQKLSTPGGDYRNNLVYRPSGEDVLDAEGSVELRLQSLPVGYPQVAVRVQASTVATTNRFDGYMLYLPDSTTTATLARQAGTGYDVPLVGFSLSQALNSTDTYRLRLRAVGANPVVLNAYVERLNGGSWQIIGQATYNDTSGQRIATPGSVAFGGYIENNYGFDNFRRVYLGP